MVNFADEISNSIKSNHSIAIACSCSVKYSGRAEAFLDFGDRIILIKSDNTLIIHQSTGNTPVNYMKPGSSISVDYAEDMITISSQNLPLKEYMTINISKVYFLNSHKLEEGCSLVLEGTEKDMSDMIYNNPELIEQGFRPVSREEQTQFGFLDVFGYDKDNTLCVIECKRYAGDLKAVDQLRRYVEKVKSSKGISKVRGILACPRISSNTEKMLQEYGFSFVKVNPPKREEFYNKSQTKLDSF